MTTKNNMDTIKDQTNDAVAQVVAAFARRADVSIDDIVTLTGRLMVVFDAPTQTQSYTVPSKIAQDAAPTKSTMVPAIPLDKAVTDDKVYCLCCGRGFSMLKRHLKAEHGLTEEEYRQAFGLPESTPLVAPNYSKRKAAYAKEVGLGKYNRETAPEEALRAR